MIRIGIAGARDYYRNENYYRAVEYCGAIPVTLAEETAGEADDKCRITDEIDGLILPGGADVDPARYGEENTASRRINTVLDETQLALIRAATVRRIPILGICRGHQLLNVFFGGTLIQNVSRCDIHKNEELVDKVHETRVEKTSWLKKIYGSDLIRVNSAHHQAVDRIGDGLIPIQYSEDRIIEAMVHRDYPIISVQWHPERMCLSNARIDTVDGLEVFRYFMGIVRSV